jgi:hypothetical protein
MSYTNVICFFIILAPFINSITGFTTKEYGLSIIGPLFYSLGLLFFLLLSLHKQRSCLPVFLLLFVFLHFFVSVIYGMNNVNDLQHYIKFAFPFIIYFSLKYTTLKIDFLQIKKAIILSGLIYLYFILLSFIIGYKQYDNKIGYWGWVGAGNDMLVFLLFLLPYAALEFTWKKKLVYFSGLFLTFTKSLFLLIPVYALYEIFLKKRSTLSKRLYCLTFSICLLFSFYYITVSYYRARADEHTINLSSLSSYGEREYRFLSFGRSIYLERFIGNFEHKSPFEIIWGSGLQGGLFFTEGKVGIEMDPFDILNNYGIFLLTGFIYLFYLKILFSKNLCLYHKFLFLPAISYSIFGGHLSNNPIANIPVAMLILLIEKGEVPGMELSRERETKC